MSMITCRECGQMVSDKSKVCIHCGYPIEERRDLDALAEEVWQLRSQVDSLRMDLFSLKESLNIRDADQEEPPEDLLFLEDDLVLCPSYLNSNADPYPKYREDLRQYFHGAMDTLSNGSDIGAYYTLEGFNLVKALDPEGKWSPTEALLKQFPRKATGVHIRIRGKKDLEGCDEAFFHACRENNIHMIQYVDAECFYDYTTDAFYRVTVSMGWKGDLLEYAEGVWRFEQDTGTHKKPF